MNEPLISCKCTTYARVDVLEESIYGFLQQEYKNKELIIVNDYPLQTLKFNHPQIKIINVDKPFPSIGDKDDFTVSQCQGDIIAVWDDDDIALPGHLENINKYFLQNTDLLHWGRGGFYNFDKIDEICCIGNDGMVYSRRIWEKVGGFHHENAGYDTTFVERANSLGANVVTAYPESPSWIYMWGGRSYHQSAMGTDTPDKPNILERYSAHIEQLRLQGKIPTGQIELNPQWRVDYIQKLNNFMKIT